MPSSTPARTSARSQSYSSPSRSGAPQRGERSGGYQRSEGSGSYQRNEGPSSYQRSEGSGSYPRSDRSGSAGGYGRSEGSGSYQRSERSGGYQRSGGSGGYGRSERSGGGYGRSDRPRNDRQRSAPVSSAQSLELERHLDAAMAAAEQVAAERDGLSWHDLGLEQTLITALERQGMPGPFPIQARTLPDSLTGKDLLGRGQTGSGKTIAFGIPLLVRLAGSGRAVSGRPSALVLVPTRELADQVRDQLSPLAHALGLVVTGVVGGVPIGRQITRLRDGVHIVVATPGRLLDHVRRGTITLEDVGVTVIDEADHMADLGFLPDVSTILEATDEAGQRLLFSATLDRGVGALAQRFLREPAVHAIASSTSQVTTMEHRAFVVRREHKTEILARIAGRPARTLLFVRTKAGADRLTDMLRERDLPALALHGGLGQGARRRALEDFSDGRARVLVATDVAARGIHIDDLDLVIHVDPPADPKDYLHRSGRTARAGASGTVLSLLMPHEVGAHGRMMRQIGVACPPDRVDLHDEAVSTLATSGDAVVPVERQVKASRGPRRNGGGGYQGRSGSGYRGQGGAGRSGGGSGRPRFNGGGGGRPRNND